MKYGVRQTFTFLKLNFDLFVNKCTNIKFDIFYIRPRDKTFSKALKHYLMTLYSYQLWKSLYWFHSNAFLFHQFYFKSSIRVLNIERDFYYFTFRWSYIKKLCRIVQFIEQLIILCYEIFTYCVQYLCVWLVA